MSVRARSLGAPRLVGALLLLLGLGCAPVELLTSNPAPDGCVEDYECGVARLCVGGVCTACPSLEGCVEPEPIGKWVPLRRNGCTVCEYAPGSECAGPSECAAGICYRGARCASGCTRLECCANVCQPSGCPEPAPTGCRARCGEGMSCGACVTTLCKCDQGTWRCDVGCADLSAQCLFGG